MTRPGFLFPRLPPIHPDKAEFVLLAIFIACALVYAVTVKPLWYRGPEHGSEIASSMEVER